MRYNRTMGRVRSRLFRRTFNVLAFGMLVVVSLATVRALGSGRIAHAATATYNPAFCLGGWEKPRHASGEVETGAGADPSAFTVDNSAYLAPDVSSQIFCGYFPVEAHDNPPASATIRLVWNFVMPDTTKAPAPEVPVTTPAATSSPDATTDAGPVVPMDPSPATDTTPPSAPSDAPAAAPADIMPTPTPGDAPTSASGSAFERLGMWIASHTSTVFADETAPTSLSDWFDVSYSLDGVRWVSIGRVNAQNWKDFTVHIPLNSWDDLQNVQIMVAALPSLTDRPAVYLDGMELRVENDPTLSENTAAAASLASDVVTSALDAVSNLGSSLLDLVTPDAPPVQTPVAQAAPAASPVAPVKMKKLAFALGSSATSTVVYGDANPLPMPEVSISADSMTLTVSGSCKLPYFVVATYRSPQDYVSHPRSFASNFADACTGGHFSYVVSHLPVDTAPGTYFLLLGEQGDDGPWHATTSLIPIIISSVEVDPTPTP